MAQHWSECKFYRYKYRAERMSKVEIEKNEAWTDNCIWTFQTGYCHS